MAGFQRQRRSLPVAIFLILAATGPVCADGLEELVVELKLNGQPSAEAVMVLADGSGSYWIDEEDAGRLRLTQPPGEMLMRDGRRYLPLHAFDAATFSYDSPTGVLHAQLPPDAYRMTQIGGRRQDALANLGSGAGVFANYRVHGQHFNDSFIGGTYSELGVFGRPGLLTTTIATRHGTGANAANRLETTLRRDFVERMQTLTLGDGITDPGSFGSALRFGGVHFEKNFAMRPGLVTAPLLSTGGTAVVPSTVDVFVNNQRVLSRDVQPGPFVIDDLPAVTGTGELRMVVRDATGREQVIQQAFYSSPQLLAAGLSQYAASLGAVRQDFGQRSFAYGAMAGSGTFRKGLTDAITVEGHGEFLQREAFGIGGQLAARMGSWGVLDFTAAYGGGAGDEGSLVGLGFERGGARSSFAVQVAQASRGFRRAGDPADPALRQKLRVSMHAGFEAGVFGSSALALARHSQHDGSVTDSISLMHAVQVGRNASLRFTAQRLTGAARATSFFLGFTRTFDNNRLLSVGAETFGRGRDERLRATYSKSAPLGEGHGWRIGASQDGSYEAMWRQRFAAAEIELQALRNFGYDGQGIEASGGLSWMADRLNLSRHVHGSFAVVDVGGLPDIPVYLENRLVARTDADGKAVLPNLLAWHANRVSIDPDDLPIDVSLGTRALAVRPGYRGGVLVKFPVDRGSQAVFRLLLPGGDAVPVGAEVRLNGGTFPVAMGGFTYVTTLTHGTGGVAQWPGGRCSFRVEPPRSDDPLPDMGQIVCRPLLEATR
jgi:outer membrane usher protein